MTERKKENQSGNKWPSLLPHIPHGSGSLNQEVHDMMTREVVTVSRDETAVEAARKMAAHGISCLVVLEGETPVGVLTERDFLKRVVGVAKPFDTIRVGEVMSHPLIAVRPGAGVLEAGRMMDERGIRRLPVIEGGRLCGILTQTDVIRVLTFFGILKNVSEIMTPHVATVTKGQSVLEAVQVMAPRGISCVVVTDGRLPVGVFTERDILKKVVSEKKNPAEVRIEEVMSSPAVSIPPGYSVFSASKLMEKMRIRRLLIAEGDAMQGILTETDIFRAVRRKVQEEERQNLQLWEQSESCIFVVDREEKVTFANPAFLRVFKIEDPSYIVGQVFLPGALWQDPDERRAVLREVHTLAGPGTRELNLKDLHGRKIYATLFSTGIKNLHGELIGWQGILKDITAEKELVASRKVQEKLKESEKRYKLLSETLSDVVMTVSPLGMLEYCSPVIKEFGGYDAAAEIGNHISKYFANPAQLVYALSLLKAVVLEKRSATLEFLYRPLTGEPFYVEVSGKPLVEDGQVKSVHCVMRDVSERKRYEKALRESEEKFKSITGAAQDAIIIIDDTGKIGYWNKGAEKIFGYEADEILGKELHALLAPSRYRDDYSKGIERFARTGQGPVIGKTLELVAVRKGGTEFPMELSVSSVSLKDRWHAIGILRDITERKKIEEELNKQRREQQAILDSVPAMIFFKDTENRLIRVNKTFADAMGMPAAVLEGKSCDDLWPAEAAEYWKADQEVIRTKRPMLNIVEPMVTAKGLRWVQTDKIPYRDNSGNVTGVIGFTLDITERKQAEEALLKEKEFSENLINSSVDGILAFDLACRYTLWNKSMERISGVLADKVIGRCAFDVFPFLKEMGQDAYFLRALEGKTIFAPDCFFRVPETGHEGFYEGYFSALRDAGGGVTGGLALIRDITESKKAAAALKMSEDKYRAIFDNSALAIIVTDSEDRIISWNPSAEGLLGMNREDLHMGPLSLFWPEEEWRRFRALGSGGTASGSRAETWLRRKGGQMIQADISITVLEDSQGRLVNRVLVLSDITERKRLDNLKSEFVSTVSHELRTPLAILREGVSQIHDGILGSITEDQKRFLGISLRSIDRLSRIVEDLLDISKMESGRVGLNYELSNLAGIAKNVTLHFGGKLREKGIEIRENFPSDWVEIYVDRDKMAQVFTNLLGNAIKFTEKGFVEISVQQKGESVECSVADSGAGIGEEDKKKLFAKFQQVGKTAGQESGTGLGLSICKWIVELHRGRIWAESELGKGTRIVFTLPNSRARQVFIGNVQKIFREALDSNAPLSVVVFDPPAVEGPSGLLSAEQQSAMKKKLEEFFARQMIRQASVSVDETGLILASFYGLSKTEVAIQAARMGQVIAEHLAGRSGMNAETRYAHRIVSFPEDGKNMEQLLAKMEM